MVKKVLITSAKQVIKKSNDEIKRLRKAKSNVRNKVVKGLIDDEIKMEQSIKKQNQMRLRNLQRFSKPSSRPSRRR